MKQTGDKAHALSQRGGGFGRHPWSLKRPRRLIGCALILCCLMTAFPAAGQSTRPSAQSVMARAEAADEALPLRVSDADAKAAATHASVTSASGAGDLSRIAVALAIVIGVILLLRSVVRQMTAIPGTGRSGKLVTVLSRSAVSPRQQVLVLQVGKRLLVVGDSAGKMSSLCEITDPDEIAMLVGQSVAARSAMAERAAGSFRSLFGRANEPFEEVAAMQSEPEAPRSIDPNEGVSGEEVRGLLDKVRLLQQQFKA